MLFRTSRRGDHASSACGLSPRSLDPATATLGGLPRSPRVGNRPRNQHSREHTANVHEIDFETLLDEAALYQLMPPAWNHHPGEQVRVLGNEDFSVPVICPAGDGWITNANLSRCYPLCGAFTTMADFNTGQFINLNPTDDRLQIK